MFLNLVNRADVGMVKSRSSSGPPLEALHRLVVVSQRFRKEFQRYLASQSRVFCFINDTHTPAAGFFDDPVVRNRLADLGHEFLLLKKTCMLFGCPE
jgi:hypothetical protein